MKARIELGATMNVMKIKNVVCVAAISVLVTAQAAVPQICETSFFKDGAVRFEKCGTLKGTDNTTHCVGFARNC